VPYNYDNTAECDQRVPVTVTVRVTMMEPLALIEPKLRITLEPHSENGEAWVHVELLAPHPPAKRLRTR